MGGMRWLWTESAGVRRLPGGLMVWYWPREPMASTYRDSWAYGRLTGAGGDGRGVDCGG